MRSWLWLAALGVLGCTSGPSGTDETIEIGETIEWQLPTPEGALVERYLVERLVLTDEDIRYQVALPSGELRWVSYQRRGTEWVQTVLDARDSRRVQAVAGPDGPTDLCIGSAGCSSSADGADALGMREDLTLLALDLRASPRVGLEALGLQDEVPYLMLVDGWAITIQDLGWWAGTYVQRETFSWGGVPIYYCLTYFDQDPDTGELVPETESCQSADT